jgi:hypothetical protein
MKTTPDVIISRFTNFVCANRAIEAALLFGSRARDHSNIASCDIYSDIDFQVVTWRPDFWLTDSWVGSICDLRVVIYVVRRASGGVSKATVLFETGLELDIVIVPAIQMRLARVALGLDLHKHISLVSTSLSELSTVLGGGYKILKGGGSWGGFYEKVVSEVEGDRISDDDIVKMAKIFICDYYWVLKKIERGELIAARRMIHHSLMETIFRLTHELRTRRGVSSFREARRVEVLLEKSELQDLMIESELIADSLRSCAGKCLSVMQQLAVGLVGDLWILHMGLSRTSELSGV